jgi:hypothetical protein
MFSVKCVYGVGFEVRLGASFLPTLLTFFFALGT